MNSYEIKHAIMSYYRFKRQMLCASECLNSDVMVIDKKGYIFDIEVKVNKYDLWKGEARKIKHNKMSNVSNIVSKYMPNKFYIAVPKELYEEAQKWVQATNNKYGIIVCYKMSYYPYPILFKKKAQLIHTRINEHLEKQMFKRVCSENINFIGRLLRERKTNVD